MSILFLDQILKEYYSYNFSSGLRLWLLKIHLITDNVTWAPAFEINRFQRVVSKLMKLLFFLFLFLLGSLANFGCELICDFLTISTERSRVRIYRRWSLWFNRNCCVYWLHNLGIHQNPSFSPGSKMIKIFCYSTFFKINYLKFMRRVFHKIWFVNHMWS